MKFTEDQFVATKWDSTKDKVKFANHFVRFVESGFKHSLFYKWFYTRLSMCCGHIAHYDQNGFYDEWFVRREDKTSFIERWATQAIYGDPKCTYSDVERVLKNWCNQL